MGVSEAELSSFDRPLHSVGEKTCDTNVGSQKWVKLSLRTLLSQVFHILLVRYFGGLLSRYGVWKTGLEMQKVRGNRGTEVYVEWWIASVQYRQWRSEIM